MSKAIQGTIAVVTGGASGIGLGVAEAFLRHFARHVFLLDLNNDRGTEVTRNLNAKHGNKRATFIKCDVTKNLESVTETILDTYKTVDVLVNSAGIVNERNPRKVMEINATAVMEWSLKYLDIMRSDRCGKGGTIVNISSMYGFIIDPYVPVYKASKFAIMGFTKSKGHEHNFKKTGVRMIAICPGFTRTNLTRNYKSWEKNQEDFAKMSSGMPWQDSERVGEGIVEVYQKADSGTAWLIPVSAKAPISEV